MVSGAMPIILVLVLGLADPALRQDLWWMLSLVVGFQVINLYLFGTARLHTVVAEEGIYYRWVPFFRRYTFLPAPHIQECFFRKWDRTKWGFSKRNGWGRCHNVNGTDGFQVVLKDGRRFYIGTQQQQAFYNAVQRMIHRK